MNYDAIRQILITRFQAAWLNEAEDAPYLPTQQENVNFTQPEGEPWCRLSIMFGNTEDASVGTTHQRTTGILYLQIFAPKQGGTKSIQQAADKLASIFDHWQYDADGWDIECRRVQLTTVGENKDGWYQKNATLTFRADKFP